MAIFRVEKNKGYTVMSNHHLRNKEISLKSKGLLSQMLSLPEDWDYTLSGLACINKESVDAIRTAVIELEKAGYVKREQKRNPQGGFAEIIYTIYEQPVLDSPILENPISDNPMSEEPISENPRQINKDKQNKEIQNTDVNNYPSNLISSLNPFSCESGNVDNADNEKDEMRKEKKKHKNQSKYEEWKKQIQTNIDYESLMMSYPYEKKLIDEIVEIMTETVMSNGGYIQIASSQYPHAMVKERFLGIDYSHIQYIIDCFKENAKVNKIKNIKQYMKALIFNAPSTIDSYFTAKVHHDMPWLGQNHND